MAEEMFNPFYSEAVPPPHNEHWAARRRVGKAMRQLTEVLVTSTPSTEDLHALAEHLEQAVERFGHSPRIYGRSAFSDHAEHGPASSMVYEINPLSGLSNPLAPPLKTWIDGDRVHGRVTLGWAYEGPPGCVHGGFVAAVFDEFMGIAQILGKQPGMTGTLEVRYRRPTPLNTELRLDAWLAEVEGRKTCIKADLYAGDQRTASCTALFVRPQKPLTSSSADEEEPPNA